MKPTLAATATINGTFSNEDLLQCGREFYWGTFGKGGVEHCAGTCSEHPLRLKRLINCDSDHLQMILLNQRQVWESGLYLVIRAILKDRGEEPNKFSVEAETALFNAAAPHVRLHGRETVIMSVERGTVADA